MVARPMPAVDFGPTNAQRLSKLPQVTLTFWFIQLLSTTVG